MMLLLEPKKSPIMLEWLKEAYDKEIFEYTCSYGFSDYCLAQMNFENTYSHLMDIAAEVLNCKEPSFSDFEKIYWNFPRIIRAAISSKTNAPLKLKQKAISMAYAAFSGDFKLAMQFLPDLSEIEKSHAVKEPGDNLSFEACEFCSVKKAVEKLEKKEPNALIATANGAIRSGLAISTALGIDFWAVLYSRYKSGHKLPQFLEGEGNFLRQNLENKKIISYDEDASTGTTLFIFTECLKKILPDCSISEFTSHGFESYLEKIKRIEEEDNYYGFLDWKHTCNKKIEQNIAEIQNELPKTAANEIKLA